MTNRTKLVSEINIILEEIREQDKIMCEEGGFKYSDPLADVVLRESTRGDGTPVLSFDGAGYDYFSYNADFNASDVHRERLQEIAERSGYFFEDLDSCALAFYPA